MSNSVSIQLNELETLQLSNDGKRINVIQMNNNEKSVCGTLSQEQINDLVELLQHCNHENKEHRSMLWNDEQVAVCMDCDKEVT